VTAPDVTIYLSDWCPYCQRAKGLLERKGAKFREINVEDDPNSRSEMVARSNGRRTVPQIFIGDTHVGGCDELLELERDGRLDRILQGA